MSDQSTLAEKREEAAKVLREILERMSVDAEVSAFDDGEKIILDAHGSESGLVIGKKGATLDSLQYLVSRIVFRKPGDSEFQGRLCRVPPPHFRPRFILRRLLPFALPLIV